MNETTDIDRRQQILDAALIVFSRKGFAAATIKDIAREANLKSPALIYWYFPNKQELLATLIMQIIPILQQVATNPQTLMDKAPEETLSLIADSFMHIFGTPLGGHLLRLLLSEIIHIPELAARAADMQKMMLTFLVMYLQKQVDLGRLRPCNTQTAARNFIGSLMVYTMSSEVFPWLREGLAPPQEFVQQAVDTFLHGLKIE